MKYQKLFEPGYIGKVEIRNRVAVTAMGTGIGDEKGDPSPDYIAYVQERIKGGLGLFITEVVLIDEEYGHTTARQIWATRKAHIYPWRKLADAVHMHGGRIFAQLQHPGRAGVAELNYSGEVIGAGNLTSELSPNKARMMTKDEVKTLVKKFARGAEIVQIAGVDGVDLHAAHGYLIHQFISPMMNNRTDEYGGSFENRMRFVTEIVEEIRKTCGPDFPISVRISASEDVPEGYGIDEGVRIAEHLEKIGVDAINVSNGVAESSYKIQEPPTFPQGWKMDYARAIKKKVKVPLIAVSVIRQPDFAEALLEEGATDFIGNTRGHLADPYWCNKAKAGNEIDIRPCISCLFCFHEIFAARGIRCAVNPVAARELALNDPKPTGDSRVVAIIGAGPGGLEAARVLAQRGFRPVVFEKDDKAGGMLHVANKLLHKERIDQLTDNMVYQAERAGAQIRLNTPATIPALKALDPYAVIVATGSKPLEVRFPGDDGANVVGVDDYLKGKVQLSGKKVAVIGGGTTGCEVAEKLATEGNTVAVVEMRKDVGLDMFRIPRRDFMFRMDDLGIEKLPNMKLESINAKGIVCEDLTSGKKVERDFDVVILSLGYQPDNNMTAEVKKNFDNVRVIGDAVGVRKIGDAVYEGYTVAYALD